MRIDKQAEERERLRDTFAAAALTGLLADDGDRIAAMGEFTARAYAWADAMLCEREQTNHATTPLNKGALGESEREAIEQMLDEASGKACAESWVPDILRNLLERMK